MEDAIKRQVKKLIKKYNTNNPFELADYLGFITILTPLENNITGISQNLKNNIVIYVDINLDYYKQLIVVSHGLAHAILHKNIHNIFFEHSNKYLKNTYEKEADLFTLELLLSNNSLYEYKKDIIKNPSCNEKLNLTMLNLKFPHSY